MCEVATVHRSKSDHSHAQNINISYRVQFRNFNARLGYVTNHKCTQLLAVYFRSCVDHMHIIRSTEMVILLRGVGGWLLRDDCFK